MRKPSRTTLRNKLDKIVSEIIRSRGSCVRCGNTQTLQACHIFSRSNLAVRWDIHTPNVICMCAACHFWAHKNPILFYEFVKEYMSDTKFDLLKLLAMKTIKIYDHELVELYEHLKEYQAKMWRS